MKLAATFTLLMLLFSAMAMPMYWKLGALTTTELVIAELCMLTCAAALAWWIHHAFRKQRK